MTAKEISQARFTETGDACFRDDFAASLSCSALVRHRTANEMTNTTADFTASGRFIGTK